MPVVTTSLITRPEELVEQLVSIIKESDLPFAYVAKYDESLVPEYPCVQVQPGVTDKFLHGTHTFQIGLRAYLYVMHAKLDEDRRTRSLEDLLLATQLLNLLEGNMTLLHEGKKVINGYIESETPAAFPPRSRKGDAVIGTRLAYICLSQSRFK